MKNASKGLVINAARRSVEHSGIAGYSATVELDVEHDEFGVVTIIGRTLGHTSRAEDALRLAERTALRSFDDLNRGAS